MKKLICLMIAILLAELAPQAVFAAVASEAPLKLEAQLIMEQSKDDAGKTKIVKSLMVAVTNVGNEPLTVITQHLESGTVDDNEVTVGLNTVMRLNDHIVVPSLATLAPVTLRPGELAILTTDSVDLSDCKGKKLMVVYEVTKEWGERFSLWSGRIKADATISNDSDTPNAK